MKLKRILCLLWPCALVFLAVFVYWAPANLVSRVATLLLVAGLLAAVLSVSWRRRGLRLAALAILAGLVAFILLPLPSRTSADSLRAEYCVQLRDYENTAYVWGGESHRGIDCSGLIRRGLIDSTMKQGITRLDSALVRHSLSMWWNDTSADALGKEYRGLTKHLFDSPSINAIDPAKLVVGDLAVTEGGVHILAYLGNQEWIEADPFLGSVVILKTPSDNPWLKTSAVLIMRWTLLAP